MKQKFFFITKLNITYSMIFLSLAFLVFQTGCEKNQEADYTADFSYEYIDDNTVLYTNESSGEYYYLTWDFGNGQTETVTDKKQTFEVFYPTAADYQVSLRLTNYTGGNKSTAKTVSIGNSTLKVSFTAEHNAVNPNYVNLTNTSLGEYDSSKWIYRNIEVENELEYQAYFPLAGTYDIELVVTKDGLDYSETQTLLIAQDDSGENPNLIWSDEFNYTGLPDPLKWNMETGGDGWGNNELQYYTNSESNAMVDNGVLTITAREEIFGDNDYTSARITTQNKFDFKYGKIEARIKLPYGQGLWPAFWMLGSNITSVGWPACGETDIMEMVGGVAGDNTVHSTLHWDNNGEHASYGQSYSLSSGIFADDFHIFSVEWNETEIKGFMDDTEYFVADVTPEQLSEFHQNFFIILNLAVGGDWPGSPDGTTSFPQTMEVDYVRVYQD